jgi:hypothetical protein
MIGKCHTKANFPGGKDRKYQIGKSFFIISVAEQWGIKLIEHE